MSSFNATTYDIERPTGQCAFTGKPLEPEQDYMAVLVEIPPEELENAANDEPQSESNTKTETDSKQKSKPGKNKTDKAAETAAQAFGLKRIDVSMEAWDNGNRPDHLFSYWKTIVPTPNEKKQMFVDNDVLLNLLRRLADADQPQRIAFRFVLSLILMRKKMLRYDKTTNRTATITVTENLVETNDKISDEDQVTSKSKEAEETNENQIEVQREVQQEWWTMTPKLNPAKGPLGKWKDDEVIEVLNPQLDEQQIVDVTEQLNEILNAEL